MTKREADRLKRLLDKKHERLVASEEEALAFLVVV